MASSARAFYDWLLSRGTCAKSPSANCRRQEHEQCLSDQVSKTGLRRVSERAFYPLGATSARSRRVSYEVSQRTREGGRCSGKPLDAPARRLSAFYSGRIDARREARSAEWLVRAAHEHMQVSRSTATRTEVADSGR